MGFALHSFSPRRYHRHLASSCPLARIPKRALQNHAAGTRRVQENICRALEKKFEEEVGWLEDRDPQVKSKGPSSSTSFWRLVETLLPLGALCYRREMLRKFKAMLETYHENDIKRAYNVGCGLCALLVIGVTTYDIHRSIKVNDTPPSREQLESLTMVTEGDVGEVNIVGLVSDTHGVLEEATTLALRRATNTIIHAGDVGDKRYKRRLSAEQVIAKLAEETGKTIISVAGNVDQGCTELARWQTLNIAGKKIVVIHICGFPPEGTGESQDLIKSEAPDIVVFGHSHVPGVQTHDQTIYINPGSAGPRRFKLPRCVAFLSIHNSGEVSVEFVPVGNLPQDIIALPTMYRHPVFASQGQDSRYLYVRKTPCEQEANLENSLSNVHYRKRRKCK